MDARCFVTILSMIQVAEMMVNTHANPSTEEAIKEMDEELANSTVANTNSSSSDFSYLTEEFLSCLKFTIGRDDYTILDNGTLYVHVYANISSRSLLDYGNYLIYDNKDAAICYYPFPEIDTGTPDDYTLSYITVIGMSISLLSLVLHFIAFLMVPEMRNLAGKNLASLTVANFFAYLLFLVGNLVYEGTSVCHPLGICTYYFMMASFFWMNAISFDIWKSVRIASKKLRKKSKNGESKWFIIYSLYSWMLPAMLTGVVTAGDELRFLADDYRPHFTDGLCWFGRRLSLIVFFAIPLGILMVANTLFFLMSGIIICNNSINSDGHVKSLKKNVTLHLKLAVIMGLVWISGLIAGTVDNKYLWYVFVCFTVLQGLFIFVAFTRFRCIIKKGIHLKEKVNTMVTIIHSSSFYISSAYHNSTKNGIV